MSKLDYPRINSLAAEAAVILRVADDRVNRLEAIYDELYEQLKFADPLKDRDFEQFLLKLARMLPRLRSANCIAEAARDLQAAIATTHLAQPSALEAAHV